MLRFEPHILIYAVITRKAFRPKQMIEHLRKTTGEYFPSCGGNTTQAYIAMYALFKKGKLKRDLDVVKDKRCKYTYRIAWTEIKMRHLTWGDIDPLKDKEEMKP